MNQLAQESSPYLLQHQNNPVDWLPWKEFAFQKAVLEQKLVIISIGYAACHWCHVMEKESFENIDVAQVMNTNFISVKVDREERPDIDQIYMNVAMITSGQGGWPLNIIALPDGKPLFAGTYFPKENWLKVLTYFNDQYKIAPDKLIEQAEQITEGLHQIEYLPLKAEGRLLDNRLTDIIWDKWKTKIDWEWGGRKGAPKFMMPNNYSFLLRHLHQTKDVTIADTLKTTLKKWAFGGLFDVVGGGFSRYSVDTQWKVPHFEKMLYDNAQLISVYAEAYQVSQRPMYKSIVAKTADWIECEMTDECGGLYSSLDADSEGVEGKFYCWTGQEYDVVISQCYQTSDILNASLTDIESTLLFSRELYNITNEGNFEHGMNVLFRTQDHEYFMEKYKINNEVFQSIVTEINNALFKARESKVRPQTDDKILTEWNALMIKGLTDAYKAFGEERYLDKAKNITSFILIECKKEDYRLDRNYKNGKSTINGFLQDYAFLIEGLIALYQVSFEEKYLREALAFTEYTLEHFYNRSNGMFYITSDLDPKLITRSMDSSDNVIPAGNSTMAKNLLLLSKYFNKSDYEQMSLTMLNNVMDDLLNNPCFFSNWAIVLDIHLHLNKELIISGREATQRLKEIQSNYLPNVLIAGSHEESELPLLKNRFTPDKTQLYLCLNKSCQLPVEDFSILKKDLFS